MKTVKYTKTKEYGGEEYEFFLDGEKIYDAMDAPYESTDGCSVVGMLTALEYKGVLKLELLSENNATSQPSSNP